ncbi:MAG: choice-of-anchor D domain-containing protein, partial [Thermoleophilaceae bacterium]
YVYLLDRDHLGGIAEGASGGDAVVARIGPYGGVWSRPAVWPGDGGYVYMPTASPSADTPGLSYGGVLRAYRYGVDGSGKPTLALAGTSTDVYGFGSGGPVVTSDGTSSGSAIVWILWSSDSTGTGAQLRAYSAVPVNGHPSLIWSAPVGTASKFAVPGVAGNRVYVGTRDGHVLGFGAPVTAPLSGAAVAFPATTVGATSNRTATFTASRSLTVTGVDVSGSQFGHGAPTPTTLSSGDTLSVPVSFTPGSSGLKSGTLTVHTSAGDASVGLSGAGRAATAQLSATPGLVSFGGTTVGGALSSTLTLANSGGTDLTLSHVASPGAPFHATGVPPDGTVLAPGSSVDVTLSFEPAAVGGYTDSVAIDSSAGSETVNLSGTATTPPRLEVSPASLDFGTAALGATASRSFTLSNTGGGPLTINKSKPPITGPFAASTALPEGTVIPAGGSATETVTFSPAASGPASDVWVITGNDGSGAHDVSFSGAGADATAPQQQQSRGGSPAPLLPGVGTVVAATRAKPVLSKLKVTSRRRISFRLSRAARVRLAVERVTRVRGCAGHLTCLRYRAAGASWTVSGRAGANSVRFGSRPHRSGKYVLAATPLEGVVRHASFKVKR